MFQYCVTVSKDSSASGYQTERCFSNMSAYSRISGDRQRIQFSFLFLAIFKEKVPSNKKVRSAMITRIVDQFVSSK